MSFKVVKIDGKGMGCIASKHIKKGTLILQEKPQCIVKNTQTTTVGEKPTYFGNLPETFNNILTSYEQMSKFDQEEYLKLHNAFNDVQATNVYLHLTLLFCKEWAKRNYVTTEWAKIHR